MSSDLRFEWLAALAYPRAIAVHANFRSDSQVTGPAILAARVLRDRFLHEGQEVSEDNEVTRDLEFVDQCFAALSEGSIGPLRRLESSTMTRDLPADKVATVAIMAAAQRLELGQPDDVLLEYAQTRVAELSSTLAPLVSLWLRLGAAVVAIARGDDLRLELRAMRDQLEGMDISGAEAFPTAKGLLIPSELVVARVKELLVDSILGWEVHLDGPLGNKWQDWVRRKTPYILGQVFSYRAHGYTEWAKRSFQDKVSSQTVIFGDSNLPGDSDLVCGVNIVEFAFHRTARSAAADLARFRLIRALDERDDDIRRWLTRSSLTLMRYGGQTDSARSAVRHVLAMGPLSAIQEENANLISAIRANGRARVIDIDWLRESAYVLPVADAAEVFDLLSVEFVDSEGAKKAHGESSWQRRESIASCLGRLAGPANRSDELVRLISERVSSGISGEEMRQLRSMVDGVMPGSAGSDELIETMLTVPDGRDLAELLSVRTRVPLPRRSEESFNNPVLEAARYVDHGMRDPAILDDQVSSAHASQVAAAVTDLTSRRDYFTVGGSFKVLDVAVALAVTADQKELWPVIVQALRRPTLGREEKSDALRRLANWAERIPLHVRGTLERDFEAIVATHVSPLDSHIDPYPEAVGMGAALGIVEGNQLLFYLSPLMHSPDPADRAAAVMISGHIPTLADTSWVLQWLIGATYDADGGVQANAAQVLAYRYPMAGSLQPFIVDRVNALLASEGTRTVRQVLVELSGERAMPLRLKLAGRLAGLARHPDWRVRKSVSELDH